MTIICSRLGASSGERIGGSCPLSSTYIYIYTLQEGQTNEMLLIYIKLKYGIRAAQRLETFLLERL